jgi:hypothetical protein
MRGDFANRREKIMKKGFMLAVGIFLLNGCLPGIMITQKEPTAQGQSVEFRLGNQVEIGDWVALQKQVCSDLEYATETLPEDVRKDIYKYSCVEPNRHDLGKVLSTLQPGQIDEICARLTEKGYIAKPDKIPTAAGEMGTAAFLVIAVFLMLTG